MSKHVLYHTNIHREIHYWKMLQHCHPFLLIKTKLLSNLRYRASAFRQDQIFISWAYSHFFVNHSNH